MTKPLANKHSIKSQKTDVIWFIFFLVSLWSSFCTQWPRADLWVASPMGVLRVAACGPSFMVVLRAPSVSACSRCWMLTDGVWWWCSTWCCLIFLLNGVWQGERKSAEKDALLSLGLLWLTLACAKLVCFCGGCACYLSFRFVFGKERGNSRRWRRRGERQHAYEQTQKKCHRRWQQPATHARKLDFTSTRQQTSMSDNRNIKNQVQKYWWIL